MLQAIKNLPRETRDTLFLLIVIAWVIAPQVNNLPLWCSGMTATILLWRGYLAVRGFALPARWWLFGLLLLATGATYFTHRTLMGRDAGVTYIVVLLSLKTLEMRAQRDTFVIFFLSFFTLLSNFFFSQSLLTAVAMLIGLLGLLTALVNSHMPVGKPPLMQAAKTAGWMALLGAPVMVALFVLFPRIAPLWGVPGDAMAGRTGLSSSMQVGTIASLALDDSVALRIRFDGPTPLMGQMYFRGPVLSSFDGREWRPPQPFLPSRAASIAQLQVQGTAYSYQVTLEPNSKPWVLVLDAADTKPVLEGFRTTMTPELQWVAERPITDLVRYSAQSYTSFRHGPLQRTGALQEYVELPPNYNPRTRQLAANILADPRNQGADTVALVNTVLERLRTGGYIYTLDPGVFGTDTADEFWFDKKMGFCEHIASSFVLLMRAMNIPARIVTGYQGGDLNGIDKYWTVRQSDAHAWSEVWMPERGWVRVDPTSAVSPGRIGTLTRLAAPRNAISQALLNVNPQFALNLRTIWEAANNRWNQWVLNYSQAKQLDVLRNLGFESPSWEDLTYVMIALIVGASLAGAAWTLWERHRQDPWLRLLHGATARLRKAGLPLPETAPPRQMAAMLQTHAGAGKPELAAIAQWLLRMETWRYARHAHAQQLGTLQREFRSLPWPQRIL
jgi:transglutaminase-like putative cysteine protease